MVELGERMRWFRAQLGLTQEQLARAARLTPKFVSQIENGRVNPSIRVLERVVVDGFATTLGVFFMWDPERADVSRMLALLARQPVEQHRRIVRVIEVLCDHDPDAPAAVPVTSRPAPRPRLVRRARRARRRSPRARRR